jgi:hypothetical protein
MSQCPLGLIFCVSANSKEELVPVPGIEPGNELIVVTNKIKARFGKLIELDNRVDKVAGTAWEACTMHPEYQVERWLGAPCMLRTALGLGVMDQMPEIVEQLTEHFASVSSTLDKPVFVVASPEIYFAHEGDASGELVSRNTIIPAIVFVVDLEELFDLEWNGDLDEAEEEPALSGAFESKLVEDNDH